MARRTRSRVPIDVFYLSRNPGRIDKKEKTSFISPNVSSGSESTTALTDLRKWASKEMWSAWRLLNTGSGAHSPDSL